MSLTNDQQSLVQRAQAKADPFSVGAAWDAAMATYQRDFFGIVVGQLLGIILMTVISVLSFGLAAPAMVIGYIRFHQKKLRNEPVDFSELFSGFNDFGQSLGLTLVMWILLAIGYICCILPGIYLGVAWWFAFFALSDRLGDFWNVMEMNRQAVTTHWWSALLFLIVIHLIAYAGLLACIIGVLVTAPLAMLMACSAYDRLFR
jgi:uncharacterized membrane protein